MYSPGKQKSQLQWFPKCGPVPPDGTQKVLQVGRSDTKTEIQF